MQASKSLVMAIAVPVILFAADAAAQTRQQALGSAPMSSVQVTAPARTFRVYQDDLDAVRGAYALSNGWRLQVSPALGGISAQIGRQRAMHLVAVSPDKYASHDGNVTMEFNRGRSGDDMIMTYVPDPRMAEVIVVKATLAQR